MRQLPRFPELVVREIVLPILILQPPAHWADELAKIPFTSFFSEQRLNGERERKEAMPETGRASKNRDQDDSIASAIALYFSSSTRPTKARVSTAFFTHHSPRDTRQRVSSPCAIRARNWPTGSAASSLTCVFISSALGLRLRDTRRAPLRPCV